MGRSFLALVVTIAVTASCSPGEVAGDAEPSQTTTEAATRGSGEPVGCPTLEPTWVPDDLSVQETVPVPQGDDHLAQRVTYANDSASRELSFLSGVAGQIGEGLTDQGAVHVAGRERTARLLTSEDTTVALWQEAPEAGPCHQYAVIALGLTADEFQDVLDALD